MAQIAIESNHRAGDFARELDRYGPSGIAAPCSLVAARAYCRQFTRNQYENFTVASFLLPRSLRQDFFNIYAFCRWSDDMADEVGDPARSLALLKWWERELELCFSDGSAHPVMLALADTVQRHSLSITPFHELLSAFRQDQHIMRYNDEASLLDYCRRSANPVGRILLQLAKVPGPSASGLSDAICTGLQLANFCQDMARDAMAGRIYAPRSHWQEHGVTETEILSAQPTERLRRLVENWAASAKCQLERGRPLLAQVPRWLARDLALIHGGGLAILDAIEAQGFDVWTRRPTVSRGRKFRLMLVSLIKPTAGLQAVGGAGVANR